MADLLETLDGAWNEDHKMNLMHYCDLGGQEIRRLRAALGDTDCPRPHNRAPDHLTVRGCVDRGECGCVTGDALKAPAPAGERP